MPCCAPSAAAARAPAVRAAPALAAGLLARVGDLRRARLGHPLAPQGPVLPRVLRRLSAATSTAVLPTGMCSASSRRQILGGFAIPQPPGTARLEPIVIWRALLERPSPGHGVHRPGGFHVERSLRHARASAPAVEALPPPSSESFLAALPSRQTLEVTAPTARAPAALSGTSASALGETASLYVLTRQMTAQVNGIVGGALDTLGDITRTPAGRDRQRLRGVGSVHRATVPGGRPAAGHPGGSRVSPLRAGAATEVRAGLGVRAVPGRRLDRRRAGWTGSGTALAGSRPRPPPRPGRERHARVT